MEELNGKVVVVTGGASGIGLALCKWVLSEGGRVGILDMNVELGREEERSLRETYGKERVVFYECNVGQRESVAKALEMSRYYFGKLDAVVNNAGIGQGDLETITRVNFYGVVYGTEYSLKMNSRGNGPYVVINTASTAGLAALSASPYYSGSKHAVVGYTRSMAKAGLRQSVIIHCFCPSFTKTAMVTKSGKLFQKWLNTLGVMQVEDVAASMGRLLKTSEPLVVTCTPSDNFEIHKKVSKL